MKWQRRKSKNVALQLLGIQFWIPNSMSCQLPAHQTTKPSHTHSLVVNDLKRKVSLTIFPSSSSSLQLDATHRFCFRLHFSILFYFRSTTNTLSFFFSCSCHYREYRTICQMYVVKRREEIFRWMNWCDMYNALHSRITRILARLQIRTFCCDV